MTHALSQRGQCHHFDALIIGAGIAGLSYALSLHRRHPNARIALLAKTQLSENNSFYAQGGMAAASNQQQAIQAHIKDTLNAGDGLCNADSSTTIISQGWKAIKFLIEAGVQFDKTANGEWDLTREGGHAVSRIYHRGDHTGHAIMQPLLNQVKSCESIEIIEQHTAVNLIIKQASHQPGSHNEILGAYALAEQTGLIHTFLAKVTLLATGGAGKVFRYTSNAEVATGDGIAMAYRAGARVGNMEFYQFHPTLLYHPTENHFLLTEALRGEGGYLRLPITGERFMQRYATQAMELATRDVVARAIFTEIEQSNANYIHLDVRHLGDATLKKRFPTIYRRLLALGIDPSKQYIPVVPAAHYLCGGVLTDPYGQTDLPRLFALGETAFSGLHGANRLASNSLLEGVVMARLAVEKADAWLQQAMPSHEDVTPWDSSAVCDNRRASQINAHWRGLRGEMTSYAGIIRTEEGLSDVLQLIRTRKAMVEESYWRHPITRDLIELRNIILIAELIVQSALARRESRGGHYRADHPEQLSTISESFMRSHDATIF